MKMKLLFLLAVFSFTLFSQQKEITYTDISPDGNTISTYKLNEIDVGTVITNSDDIPFGDLPDWTSTLERQIGGMAWGDYDNDGDLDLATGCYFSNSFPPIPDYEVLIYRNDNGILTSSPAWISSDEKSTTDVKFADLDGDGKPELIAANGDNSFVPSVIYFNSETGLNNSPGWVSQDNNWTVGEALCDIDNDGDLDLVFGNQGNSVTPTKPISIFFNNNGTFPAVPDWLSADEMISGAVALGDMNNSHLISETLEYTGDGIRNSFPLPFFPVYSIDTVLIDGLMYNQFCYDPVGSWISLGTKPGTGTDIKIIYRYVSAGDLAASKWVNYESGIYFNNNGTVNTLPGWTVGNTQSQKGIVWADFDNDGYQDLAVSGSGVQTVIYKNINGSLTGPVWTSNSVNPSAQELISGDVDRDGYPELAAVHFGSRRIEIFKNRSGILDNDPTWLYIAGSSATSVSFGDVNGDGALDLAIGTARSPVVVFINQLQIPVELTSFNAIVYSQSVELNWVTATETNNQGFDLERCLTSAGSDYIWKKIGFVEGSGTISERINYSFTDRNLIPGNYMYRLKQIDYDGTYSYSDVVKVEISAPDEFVLNQNYPNPFNPVTNIKWNSPFNAHLKLKIFDILGKEIVTLVDEYKTAGTFEVEFNADALPGGTYFYQIQSGTYTETKKMFLLK